MKARLVLVLILAGASFAGCGRASPSVTVSCVNDPNVTVQGGGGASAFFLVRKGVVMDEPGAGAAPANGITADVLSPVEFIQICAGDCIDGGGNFGQTKEVTTDENGFLTYTLGFISPPAMYQGDVIEAFNPQSQCSTRVNYTP